MDLSPYRSWLILFHVLSVFGFLLVHGISVGVSFKLRAERNRAKVAAYLELSNAYFGAMYVSLLLVLVSGILAGIGGGWWTSGRYWIWASVVVLVLLAFLMPAFATSWFNSLREAVGLETFDTKRKGLPLPTPKSDAELAVLLNSSRPALIAVMGIIGLGILGWLMVLKPF